jgi:hypothetical protein
MQTAASVNLGLTDSSSMRLAETRSQISYGRLYQQFALRLIERASASAYTNRVGNELLAIAGDGYGLRQLHVVEQVVEALLRLPLSSQFASAVRYFEALCVLRRGELAEARAILEAVAEEAPLAYRSKAMLTLAALSHESGDPESSLVFCVEASRAAASNGWCDPKTLVISQRNIAIHKSLKGDHRGALADLENLFPLVRAVGTSKPYVYYDYLNSLAVELCEAGRLEEALRASEIVIASPYASAYPEWHETRKDISLKAYRTPRSFVAFKYSDVRSENVFRLPVPGIVSPSAISSGGRAKILNYTNWKKKMVKEPYNNERGGNGADEVSDRQMLLKIVELASTDDLPDDALRDMVEALQSIVSTYKQKEN